MILIDEIYWRIDSESLSEIWGKYNKLLDNVQIDEHKQGFSCGTKFRESYKLKSGMS